MTDDGQSPSCPALAASSAMAPIPSWVAAGSTKAFSDSAMTLMESSE
jgi:hypothetical protein